ncbi:lysophospholipase L1-like esterase [Spinactinospora alkalitolerans]|uniref:Lysophospholipase L1-like esterase n=1 Tax=Spinactinospora alkalitolerans TaxID=687207 RepID=A0A852U140_9ACTN|nr:SGNH/GDSL hydrolase family protein [Spinactinospora alkalitolerans]NYE49938.1 lysophospholipase L1-like esterase [Spinactinospora alkalitolerans]
MSPDRTARRVVAAALGLAGAVTVAAAPAQAADSDLTSRYVALGDSFTAGPLIPDQYGDPVFCLRSRKNYPNVVARALGVADFQDASCSGATTEHMTDPQELPLGTENDPQFDALTEDTTLVTLGVGGNDLGFGEILLTCVGLSAIDPTGDPCRTYYTDGDGGDRLADRLDETGAEVAEVLAGIRERSPDATVAVVGYLQILPESQGCWPVVPIAEEDVAYLDRTQTRLNETLAKEAANADAVFVDVFERGHDVCSARDDKWVEGIFPTKPAAPVHPNETGMAEAGARVVEALGGAAPAPLV